MDSVNSFWGVDKSSITTKSPFSNEGRNRRSLPLKTAWAHSLAKTGARLSLSATEGPAAVSVMTLFWVTGSIPTPENTVYSVTP